MIKFCILIFVFTLTTLRAEVIQLTESNLKSTLDANELVLVDFYASWCYFSNILDPIFTETSNKLDTIYKDQGKVILAKVDCEQQSDISKQYGIRKYPTLKLFRFGEVGKREYRGARNADAFIEFIKAQLEDPIKELGTSEKLTPELGKSYLIGHFKSKTSSSYILYRKIAYQLRDECNFYVQIIPESETDMLTYESFERDTIELLKVDDEESMKQWILKACTPIVRRITFQNAEDITEEGLPLILLFHGRGQDEVISLYTKFVTEHLMNEKKTVNFVYADGQNFAHPLMHLGKTEADLPLIAVDSFQHMFVLSSKVEDALKNPEILKKFVSDLHSGKLHREFHNGPDVEAIAAQSKDSGSDEKPKDAVDAHNHETTPIPSVFKKLRPNSNRYTLFHDEF